MSDITDSVNVTIVAAGAKISAQGFGLPLLLSHTAAWTERTREYSNAAGVLADFSATSPEYLAASAMFGQTPRPPKLVIGRCALKPTQRFRLTPVAVNSYTYRAKVNGTTVSFGSDASATVGEAILGLKASIDALALDITTSDQTTYLRIVANNPGDFFNIESLDRANLALLQDHADPGVATDLAAIALERNDWYAIGGWFNSSDYVKAVAAYALANKKLYGYQTVDTVVPQTPVSGTDDIGEYLKNAGNTVAFGIFSPATGDFAEFGLMGRCLPLQPGSETWKFKQIAGLSAGSYTQTERANMIAKNINFYEPTLGVNMTAEGVVASGRFIDFARFIDYAVARIGERVFQIMVDNDKVPYDDNGIGLIEAEVAGFFSSEASRNPPSIVASSIVVTVPLLADVLTADKTTRTLNNVTFAATYSGAIHKANISGTISL